MTIQNVVSHDGSDLDGGCLGCPTMVAIVFGVPTLLFALSKLLFSAREGSNINPQLKEHNSLPKFAKR